MASDEEIARQVRRWERDGSIGPGGDPKHEELEEYKRTAGEIHDELARRIGEVEEEAASAESLAAVAERLQRLEARLDDLEERL
ncbi:hypothetical protein [Natronomonas marina]|jgi:ubiquinone biosynthesis protein UbiJ|uniref:hypothetical protein n=1 Tax=Natronomonas marina TaxID=2961939 RepID=UPI0020C9D6BA|nr:hypothetical protein [Natronomonas marina]